jgi:hypothetical protein
MNDSNYILGPSSSPETGELTKALAAAQAEYPLVAYDAKNTFFKDQKGRPSGYASYAQCCEALRGPLTKHGLALPDFRPGFVSGMWVLVGTLRHSSGQWIAGVSPLLMPKGDMQSFGSACTYAKRTLLMALTGGFSGEPDDDGNSVQRAEAPAKQEKVSPAERATKSMEIEARAAQALAQAKTREAGEKVLDTLRLRISQKVCDPAVLVRTQKLFDEVFSKEAVTNG